MTELRSIARYWTSTTKTTTPISTSNRSSTREDQRETGRDDEARKRRAVFHGQEPEQLRRRVWPDDHQQERDQHGRHRNRQRGRRQRPRLGQLQARQGVEGKAGKDDAREHRGGRSDRGRHPLGHLERAQQEADAEGDEQGLEADRDRAQHVEPAVVAGRGGAEGEHADHERCQAVQAKQLPHVLAPKHHELEQQHEHRDHGRRAREDGQLAGLEALLEDERDHRQHGQQEARDGELGDLVEPELGVGRLDHHDHDADPERLCEEDHDREQDVVEAVIGGQPPGRDEHVQEDHEQDQLLHRRAPAQQREAGAGVLERPRLLDHPELERRAVTFDRDPAGLREDDEKEGGRGQQMRGPGDLGGRSLKRLDQRVGQVGVGDQRHGEDDDQDRRLAEGAEAPQAARAELGVRSAGVERGQRDREAGQGEDEAAAQDVAHIAELEREVRQHRDQERHRHVAGERRVGCRAEDDAGVSREDRLLVEELGDVVVGLEQPGAAAHLDDGLGAGDDAHHQRAQHEHRPDLKELDHPVAQSTARASPTGHRTPPPPPAGRCESQVPQPLLLSWRASTRVVEAISHEGG